MKTLLFILMAYLSFAIQGCVVLDYFKGSPKKDPLELEVMNTNLQKRIEILEKEKQRIRDESEREIAKAKDKNRLLNRDIEKLKEENDRIRGENKVLVEQMAKRKVEEKRTPPAKSVEKKEKPVKISVLSGDGDIGSAKSMATKLKKLGYEIHSIGKAPRSNFTQNTVYFKNRAKSKGQKLASRLGKDTVLKPLTWKSAYDLIVVTGEDF